MRSSRRAPLRKPLAALAPVLLVALTLAPGPAGVRADGPPATAPSADTVRVAAAGDIACPADDPPALRSCQQAATAALVERLAPDAVLAVGDLQYPRGALSDFRTSYDRTWGAFFDITYPVPGNHEYYGGGDGYFAYWGSRAGDPAKGWYSFELGAWHVLALNSNCSEIGGCGPGSAQGDWIRRDLALHPTACSLAFFHHPRYSSGPHGSDDALAPLWRLLLDGGVDVVLSGHDHDYERFAPQDADGNADPSGIREFVVGTGGAPTYFTLLPRRNSQELRAGAFGVLLLTLRAHGYEWSFEAIAGTGYHDSGTAACD